MPTEDVFSSTCAHCVVASPSVKRIICCLADQTVMALFPMKCGVGAAANKSVIARPTQEPEALFTGLEIFGIAAIFRRVYSRKKNNNLSRGWIWSFTAADADRKFKDLGFFFVRILLRNEGDNTGFTDLKKTFLVSFDNSILKYFSCVFCVTTSGSIVKIKYGLASLCVGFNFVDCIPVLITNLVGIKNQIGWNSPFKIGC